MTNRITLKSFVPTDLPPGSKLAFDVNVSNKDIGQYARAGYVIVCCCEPSESDESFLDRAWVAGATHVFSQDADIGNIIQKENYDMIWKRYV